MLISLLLVEIIVEGGRGCSAELATNDETSVRGGRECEEEEDDEDEEDEEEEEEGVGIVEGCESALEG